MTDWVDLLQNFLTHGDLLRSSMGQIPLFALVELVMHGGTGSMKIC